MKTETAIRNYVQRIHGFTWVTEIAQHTIWGFKGASFKSFNRAVAKVRAVIDQMTAEGLVEVVPYHGYQDQIYYRR